MAARSTSRKPAVEAAACSLLAAALLACQDGGWGEPLPDIIIGDLPDNGSADGGGASADGSSADVPGLQDAGGGSDAGDADVVHPCGEGPGNEKGVGKPCTKGGGQCTGDLSCDVDLDPKGVGVCILLMCVSHEDCGSGATCCTPSGSPIKVCIVDECLPPECGGQGVDGGTADGGSGGDGA